VHHPSINKAVAVVQKATEQLKVRAYDESDGTGELRYIQVRGPLLLISISVMNLTSSTWTQDVYGVGR
jgi:tRNA/tmRNA/rRNA uracil-C5-methylase (TrmA/RlmC/RlmD family)